MSKSVTHPCPQSLPPFFILTCLPHQLFTPFQLHPLPFQLAGKYSPFCGGRILATSCSAALFHPTSHPHPHCSNNLTAGKTFPNRPLSSSAFAWELQCILPGCVGVGVFANLYLASLFSVWCLPVSSSISGVQNLSGLVSPEDICFPAGVELFDH